MVVGSMVSYCLFKVMSVNCRASSGSQVFGRYCWFSQGKEKINAHLRTTMHGRPHIGANGVRYDTIRDAILTCARKPT